ncbi:helix-turn-helix transcriptional regulator [Dactylosporangium sp. CA-092794]|uniref:helix-turn-helix transcriptional regulator n=1 Tax=Dactylosporangium sp. CA-092794 TaxID=3239929 RepID=UPI003D9356D0
MNASRISRDIRAIAKYARDSSGFRHESAQRIAEALDADAYCFAETDPESLLPTTYATGGIDRSKASVLHLNEHGQRDFLKLRSLMGAPAAAGSLLAATAGEIERSQRYRDLLRPLGLGDEIRAVAKIDGRAWGFLHLFRRHGRPRFSWDEVGLAAVVSPVLAAGIRDAVLGAPTVSAPGRTPVLIVIDAANRIVESTGDALAVLDDLRDAHEPRDTTPDIAVAMAVCARARGRQPGANGRAGVRIHTRSGRWMSLDAAVTSQAGDGRVAVIIQPAAPRADADVWRARYGLSPGEGEVVERMLAGRSTAQIAADLVISTWTVQDRFNGVFRKAGVRSRRELTALLRPHD